MPKISVVMGIYNTNCEKMVQEAIFSILNQTYSDFEFLICDDGSTDGTFELLKRLTINDNRVILLRNCKNCGLAASLNRCLNLSKGEYIARMDADDVSLLNRFEEQVRFLDNNHEYVLVGSSANLIDELEIWGIRKMIECPSKEDFLFKSPFIHPTVMCRKDVLDELGGYRIAKETLRAEDYDLFMRIYAANYKGYNLLTPLYNYREDKNAYKKRIYSLRVDEAKIRYRGFKALKLLPKGFLYVIKPLVVGLIPQKILEKIRNERIKK